MAPAIPSFRDPAGFCFSFQDRIFRFVSAGSLAELETFLATDDAKKFVAEGKLVSSRRLSENEVAVLRSAPEAGDIFSRPDGVFFEHEKVFFPAYPHEWPAEMLWAAGKLTLEIARAALATGYGLKDATPTNILFRGSEPVFVDVLSFERRDPCDPIWKPYAQFVRTFLLPLLAARRWNLSPGEIFMTRRDGIEPEEIYRWCGPLERLTPRILSLVSIPTWLSRRAAPDNDKIYQPRLVKDPAQARFILESMFRRLDRGLDALRPAAMRSAWSEYMGTHSYDQPAFAEKEKFVREALAEFKPARVLDAGANTGHFSRLATETGAAVVAMDLDAACVGSMWRGAREKRLNILPVVTNLARPSPPLGWRNREFASFLDRSSGKFDGVLMLALIHHLLVTDRIPLEEILRLAAELTNQLLVIEFIEPRDEMFRRLTRGRGQLHASLDVAVFEAACRRYFDIVRSSALPGTARWIYCCRKKGVI